MPAPFPRHGTWRTWTTLHGLPSLNLHAVAQDARGYLWAGTAAHGLGRYDGEGFRTYTTRDGLPSNRIYALLGDRQGRLWIGMAPGDLCWYDGKTFHTFEGQRSVTALAEDAQGRIWFCGGRHMGYHDDEGLHDLSEAYVRAHGDLPFGASWGIVPDVAGWVWFGGGVLIGYDGTHFRAVADQDLPVVGDDNVAIGRHPQGGLWLSWGRRVWHYHDGQADPTTVPERGVDWFNNRRLLAPIGSIPPVEFEQRYYHQQRTPAMVPGLM